MTVLAYFLIGSAAVAQLADQPRLVTVFVALTATLLAIVVLDTHRRQGSNLRSLRSSFKGTQTDLSLLGDAHEALSLRLASIELTLGDLLGAHYVTEERINTRLDLAAVEAHSLVTTLRQFGQGLETHLDHLVEHKGVGKADLEAMRDRLEATIRGTERSLRSEVLSEIDGLLQLHDRTNLSGERPLVGSWAMSPRGMLQLVNLTEREKPRLVVECGPGTSTVYIAATLKALGIPGARIVALEHDPSFSPVVRHNLEALGLSEFVEVRDAPLVDWEIEGETYRWYAPSAIADLEAIDLLLVDGPPKSTGPLARYPAWAAFREKLKPGAVVVLDDASRPDEMEATARWTSRGSLIREKGLSQDHAVLRVGSTTNSTDD